MTEQVLVTASLDDIRLMIREEITKHLDKQPARLVTAREAKEILGIVDHRAFVNMGITPRMRGKRKLYSIKDLPI